MWAGIRVRYKQQPLPHLCVLRRIFGTGAAELYLLLSQAALVGPGKMLLLWSACLERVAGVILLLILATGVEQHLATQECLWEPTMAWSMKSNRQVWRVVWESQS